MNHKLLVESVGLTKYYGRFAALDNVSIRLNCGEIYGLIGKNGAGKTTLMRTLAGLSIPTSGRMSLFGQDNERKMREQRKKIGCMIENPEVIILDEPINGLDPIGVAEIRDLIIALSKKNITILISSHNLPELYQVATQYIFINNGRIVRSMSLQELEKESNPHLLISCNQLDNLAAVLKSVLHTNNFKIVSDNKIELYDYMDNMEYVSKILAENHIAVTTFSYQEETLENYFLALVGGKK